MLAKILHKYSNDIVLITTKRRYYHDLNLLHFVPKNLSVEDFQPRYINDKETKNSHKIKVFTAIILYSRRKLKSLHDLTLFSLMFGTANRNKPNRKPNRNKYVQCITVTDSKTNLPFRE